MDTNETALPETGWEKLRGALPHPIDPVAADLLWQEFCAQFQWYDRAATRNRWAYQILKFLTLGSGAAVTVLAALSAPAPVTASVGAVIVVLEGAQQIGQFHFNWINYRATAEFMRQHGFFYAAGTTPYDDPLSRRSRLARFMGETIAKEGGVWADSARKADRDS